MTALLERAVAKARTLPDDQQDAIAALLLDEIEADDWDRRIEADALAGRLDALGQQADDDFEAGRATPL